ncbi:hypothetical protein VTH82DRAFT_6799 [Thermothelomyces myriococcoides]
MLLDPHDWQKLVASILTKIIGLFRAGKASPLAVDFENRSLLHYLALSIAEIWRVGTKLPTWFNSTKGDRPEYQQSAGSSSIGLWPAEFSCLSE